MDGEHRPVVCAPSGSVQVRYWVPDGWAPVADAPAGGAYYCTTGPPQAALIVQANECPAPPDWSPSRYAEYAAEQFPGARIVRLPDGTWLAYAKEYESDRGRVVHNWQRLHAGPTRHTLFAWTLVGAGEVYDLPGGSRADVVSRFADELERAAVSEGASGEAPADLADALRAAGASLGRIAGALARDRIERLAARYDELAAALPDDTDPYTRGLRDAYRNAAAAARADVESTGGG